MASRFMKFCDDYSGHFVSRGRNSVDHARGYVSGLLGRQRRKNMETICWDVGEADYQGIEQFISSSPWDERPLLAQLANDASGEFGGEGSALYIDETSFVKKGNASAGVKRQYCGRLGKLENCQVGVFACLGRRERCVPVDFRLFLPEDWAADPGRCAKAGVPEESRVHRTKLELALEMVAQARSNGVAFEWVGGDALYGGSAGFVNALEDQGERFLCDVGVTTKVWTSRPRLERAKPEGAMGRPRKRGCLSRSNTARYASVKDLREEAFARESRAVAVRQSAKGRLKFKFWASEVWTWEPERGKPRRRLLLVRENEDGTFKYSLANLPADTGWEKLAYMQAQRFWIEHSFHEAKSQLGMAQYQVRVWKGWHHHMALVCLAALFVVKEQRAAQKEMPLLSARDITALLDIYLPRRERSESEIYRQIRERHRARKRDLDRRRNNIIGLRIPLEDPNLTK